MPPLNDTDPHAAAAQLALLRQASVHRRTTLALSLSAEVITLARRAIRRLHPDWSDARVNLEWVAIHYGRDWARRLAPRLGLVFDA